MNEKTKQGGQRGERPGERPGDDTYDALFCFDGKCIPLNTPHAGAPAQGERITAEAVSLGLYNMVCTFKLNIWKHCLSIESSRKWCSHWWEGRGMASQKVVLILPFL